MKGTLFAIHMCCHQLYNAFNNQEENDFFSQRGPLSAISIACNHLWTFIEEKEKQL